MHSASLFASGLTRATPHHSWLKVLGNGMEYRSPNALALRTPRGTHPRCCKSEALQPEAFIIPGIWTQRKGNKTSFFKVLSSATNSISYMTKPHSRTLQCLTHGNLSPWSSAHLAASVVRLLLTWPRMASKVQYTTHLTIHLCN
jgi:hypothetical protein